MKKYILTILVTMFSIVALGQTNEDYKYWNNVIESIALIESDKNPNAINKQYVGYLQIAPIVIKDCNKIIGETKYSLNDRFNIQKSKEMFIIIQNHYNKERNIEKGIRIWCGGPKGHLQSKTLSYYNKVINKFKQLSKSDSH